MIITENIINFPKVDENNASMRLDKFLASNSILSRSKIQKAITDGFLKKNNEIFKDNSYKVEIGDEFILNFISESTEVLPENIELDIVYEDDDIVIINKPVGMVVHPSETNNSRTLVNALLYKYGENLSSISGAERRGIVHRLDKDTSGLLVVAKNDEAHTFLSEQFSEKTASRKYIAVTYGMPNPIEGMVVSNIGRSLKNRKKMAELGDSGKEAVTYYKTMKTYKTLASIVECSLETGRTHQIRVHMAGLGCHIIGDDLYVKPKKTSIKFPENMKSYILNFPRQALHSFEITIIHPRTKEEMTFNSELPKDISNLIATLDSIA